MAGLGLASPQQKPPERLIPDEAAGISAALIELVDVCGCDLVLTTGGSRPGPAATSPRPRWPWAHPRDAGLRRADAPDQPEVRCPGHPVAPGRGDSRDAGHAALIINLPGQPKAIRETLEGLRAGPDGEVIAPGIFAAVPYCIDLIGGPYAETRPEVGARAFRPKSAQRPAAGAA